MFFQQTPLQMANKNKRIIDGKCAIKIRDTIYPILLKCAKSKVKYKIVRDNELKKIDDHPIIIVANHTRFQDTPIICQILADTLHERGYIFAGKQKLGFLDNLFFYGYGSIFMDRKDKKDMAMAQMAMEEYLDIGRTMIIFPEATWNMSAELLMHAMKWGVIKSANRKDAQIIPTVLDYDNEKMECHITYGEPRLIRDGYDPKEEIDSLRFIMAGIRFSYIEKHFAMRELLDVEEEKRKINSVVEEYPNYDVDYEQSCIYEPYPTPEKVYAPIKKLVPSRQNAFLFNKRNKG